MVLPFGAVCTPCKPMPEMPVLPYAPVVCSECSAVLSPYCMVDYHQKRWQCCLCSTGNSLPRNYHGKELSTGAECPTFLLELATPEPLAPATHTTAVTTFRACLWFADVCVYVVRRHTIQGVDLATKQQTIGWRCMARGGGGMSRRKTNTQDFISCLRS